MLRRIREVQTFDIDIASAYENLYEHFQYFNQPDSTFKYLELAYLERSVLTKRKLSNLADFQQILLNRERVLSNLEKENLAIQSKYQTYFFLIILVVFIVIGIILLRGNRQKEKANILLAEQKDKIESALNQLKSTQAQLIQAEKMASLGELTAGIAHEIQNPLNFVNNFSEVSSELLDEMNEELDKGDIDEAKFISNDIKQNLEKINLHGKRADAIVKGMLEHSRSSKGEKVPTNINVLADEFLRLSYHGFRAKDKSFNADYSTDFDPTLPLVSVVAQDMGRVLLNLINNAFQAVKGVEKPKVTVSTKQLSTGIQISVADNGSGIPEAIKEKIFQPFFTTKPTGQGTGLGLSLSYDIIKAHGGNIKIESKENYTNFIIELTK
jgi:C4-dicarboxylate-specific signal transduction histidine kinase